jgi:hypothetical protein
MAPLGRAAYSNASLFRLQRTGSTWKAEMVMDLDSPGPLTLDPHGMLLYPVPAKGWNEVRLEDVLHWRTGGQVPVVRHPVVHYASNGPMKVLRDHSGCVWMGFAPGSMYDCGNGVRRDAPFAGALTGANLHEGSNGDMIFLGGSLLAVGRPGSFRVATRANGLPGLLDAIPGRDGTIWLGTTSGLYRFASPFRIDYWTIRDGLTGVPWSVARIGGRAYAGLGDGRIAVLSEDRMRWDTVVRMEGQDSFSSLLGMEDGTFLASLMNTGTYQFGTNGKVLARTEKNHPRVNVRLARTPNGDIWLGGGGLGRLTRQGNVLQLDAHPLQTPSGGNVLAIKYEEHTRKLFSCYDGGLVVRDEQGDWKEYTTADGLLGNACWSLAPLPNGDVWYAYRGIKGLTLIQPAPGGHISVRHYGAKDGIGDNDTIDADQRGWLWRDAGTEIDVADEADAEAGKWLALDQSDGFPANDMNSGSVFVDNDSSLWWGADNDLAHYTPPADLVTPQFAPQVFVSALSWDGASPKMAEAVAGLPHGSKVVAHIGSLQFDRRHAFRLRYRILRNKRRGESRVASICRWARFHGARTRSKCKGVSSRDHGREL